MSSKEYYSVRTGKIASDYQSLDVLKKLFGIIYNKLEVEGYFQRFFGIDCVDSDYIPGELGPDIDGMMFIKLRKTNLYPISSNLVNYTEDDLFDVLEFLHDHCSKGLSGFSHGWNQSCYHHKAYSNVEGQKYFRELINPILKEYGDGFEISDIGEILTLGDRGLSNLLQADLPTDDKENINDRVNFAILKFRRHNSTTEDRKEAVKILAEVLEFIRPSIKRNMNSKDEDEIFSIANNFGIRHHNKKQKIDYDKPIRYNWMFYYYLATIHTILRIVKKQ